MVFFTRCKYHDSPILLFLWLITFIEFKRSSTIFAVSSKLYFIYLKALLIHVSTCFFSILILLLKLNMCIPTGNHREVVMNNLQITRTTNSAPVRRVFVSHNNLRQGKYSLIRCGIDSFGCVCVCVLVCMCECK